MDKVKGRNQLGKKSNLAPQGIVIPVEYKLTQKEKSGRVSKRNKRNIPQKMVCEEYMNKFK